MEADRELRQIYVHPRLLLRTKKEAIRSGWDYIRNHCQRAKGNININIFIDLFNKGVHPYVRNH
jgi:hypothetical protein